MNVAPLRNLPVRQALELFVDNHAGLTRPERHFLFDLAYLINPNSGSLNQHRTTPAGFYAGHDAFAPVPTPHYGPTRHTVHEDAGVPV